jgi:hypothetical protein
MLAALYKPPHKTCSDAGQVMVREGSQSWLKKIECWSESDWLIDRVKKVIDS